MPFIPLFQSPKSFYRLAVASFFFLQGLVFASWASRIPDIKQALDLNEAQLGGVLFAIPVGQMSAMALSGYLVSRFGSHRMLLLAALLYSGTLMALGFISETWQLFAMLVFFGVAANLHNISVNTQAVGVERLSGCDIAINDRFHLKTPFLRFPVLKMSTERKSTGKLFSENRLTGKICFGCVMVTDP